MTEHAEDRDAEQAPSDAAAPGPSGDVRGQRYMLGIALALLAAILVIAARTDQTVASTGDRVGRQIELRDLIITEQERNEAFAARVEDIASQIAEYEATATVGSAELRDLQTRVDEIAVPAGLTPVAGDGVVVTLTDSSLPYGPGTDPNALVIHESDLRAVVNALFAGGAEALSINDSRVLATTGIRCVGNTLYLNGNLYAPPFVIRAIGDERSLRSALDLDPEVAEFRQAAAEFELGYQVDVSGDLQLPAYSGLSGLRVAEPAPGEE